MDCHDLSWLIMISCDLSSWFMPYSIASARCASCTSDTATWSGARQNAWFFSGKSSRKLANENDVGAKL
jgi:hypothetical protein